MVDHVFVCGAGASGTTLMLALLDSHSDISAIPSETGIFHRVRDDEAALATIARWRERYRLPHTRYIAEKTPVHALYLGRLFQLLPDAKVIFMVRDGRDASLSEARRLDGDFKLAAKLWARFTRAGLQFIDRPNLRVVRYEHLIRDTRAELTGICHFLGLQFETTMLEHHKTARLWWDEAIRPADPSMPLMGTMHKRNRNWQINQPIYDGAGRWRQIMSDEQKAIFKAHAGDILVSLGYASGADW